MIEPESHSLRKKAALLTCGRPFARRQQVVVGLGVVIKSCFGSVQAFRQYQEVLSGQCIPLMFSLVLITHSRALMP